MDTLGKITAILIGVILLFLFPLMYMAQKQDAITQSYVLTETTELTNAIKNNGYLTDSMYTTYLNKLNATNNVYEINIEHSRNVVNPIYDEEGNFLNKTTQYDSIIYTEDILKEIYESEAKIYKFNQGDTISFRIVNRRKTFAAQLQQMLYASEMPQVQIYVSFGGVIRDENY